MNTFVGRHVTGLSQIFAQEYAEVHDAGRTEFAVLTDVRVQSAVLTVLGAPLTYVCRERVS